MAWFPGFAGSGRRRVDYAGIAAADAAACAFTLQGATAPRAIALQGAWMLARRPACCGRAIPSTTPACLPAAQAGTRLPAAA